MPLEGDAALAMMRGFSGRKSKYRPKNGLICPDCGEGLVDPEPHVIHMDPPRKRTLCTKCNIKGWRDIEEVKPDDDEKTRETHNPIPNEDEGVNTSN